ncbi:IS1096 element passenger TnpR family protein [Sulfurivirga caldicuralii]|uniref:IS1096 element passenger TnpR family protein n=1 Tax=Sulfurivirga caldicuralii TaxID=364032 RepID=UPI002E102570
MGGIPGYEALCTAMGDTSNPQRQDYIDWLGKPFDPEAFDLEAVQRRLYCYLRHSRDRARQWDMPTPRAI